MNETPKGKPLSFLSVCSGMEAASIAFEPLGWKAVGFCEIDPFASAVLAHRFPNTPNYGDLTKYKEWPLSPGSVDVLIGGPPCQAFSVAGLRRGLADPRGNLTLTYLGLVDHVRPEWVIYENVPGLLSVDGGRTFGTFLHALGQLGYGWAYRILDAQHVGECRLHPHRRGWSAVPQRRRRVFVVARRGAGGWAAAAEVLSLREGVRRHLAAGGKKGKGVAPGVEGGVGADGRQWPARTACTLNAAFGQKLGLEDQHALGGASLFVMSSGQANAAISENLAHTLNATHETQTVVIDRAASHWQGSDVHPTLNQSAKGSGGVGASNQEIFSQGGAYLVPGQPLPFRKSKRAQSTTDDESWVEAGQSNTLNNFDLGDTRTTHAVVQPIAFQPGNLRREAGSDPSTEAFPTLKSSAGDQSPHVAHPVAPLDGMNLLSRLGQCGEEHSMQDFTPGDPSFTLRRGGSQHGVLTPMAVRRLTPNECLRLQGFPDFHTQIPWKGKPAEQCPDGPQYKCAGNSFAVPVVRWIGTRIASLQSSEQDTQ